MLTNKLRSYQTGTLEVSKKKFDKGVNRQLIKHPTGTGKTVLFANVPDFFGFKRRSMFLVHREELATQAAEKLAKWNPGKSIGVEMAFNTAGDADLVVGSVATIGREGSTRLKLFKPEDFDSIIIDESHHSSGETYKNILKHFDVWNNKKILCMGVTATPNRADGKGLNSIFQEIVYDYSLLQAIKDGWLSDLKGVRVRADVNLDGIKMVGGDFNLGQLDEAINTQKRNGLIVKAWLDNGQDRQTVAFCSSIAHSQELAKAFKEYGVSAEAIWGDDPDRAEKLAFHRSGNIKVLTNCNILTEGYDDWRIGCIIMARPTRSETLFTQCIGRGTRIPDGIDNLNLAISQGITPSKLDCIILDVCDVTSQHSLVSVPSLFGLGTEFDFKGKSVITTVKEVEEIQKKHAQVIYAASLADIKSKAEKIDLFKIEYAPEVVQFSEYVWHKVGNQKYSLQLPNKEQVIIENDLLDNWEIKGTVLTKEIDLTADTFEAAIRLADEHVKTYGGNVTKVISREGMAWHSQAPTEPQLATAKKFKIFVPEGATRKMLYDAINAKIASFASKKAA